MKRTRRELRERLEGVGDLYDGGRRLRKVGYRIWVYQELVETGTFGKREVVEGHQVIDGLFHDVDGSGDFWGLHDREEPLSLHLSDGRTWACFLEADGRALCAGDLVDAKGSHDAS